MDIFDTLPPWDAATWFQTPKVTRVSTISGTTLLVKANPNRVALIIGNSSSGTNTYGIESSPPGVGPQQCFLSNNSLPYLLINFRDHGPLVQMDWYVTSSFMGTVVVVYEIILNDWPRSKPRGKTAVPTNPPQPEIRRGRNLGSRADWPQ